MMKKIISSAIVCSMLAFAAAPFAALADGDSNTVIYEMNNTNEVKLGNGSDDTWYRETFLEAGMYGRDADDISMGVSMNTNNGSRPGQGNNKGLARFDINKSISVGGTADISFYMASEYILPTNVSLIALNGSGNEVAVGYTESGCIGRTFTIESNGDYFSLLRNTSYEIKNLSVNAEKDRWYNYTIRVNHTAIGQFNMKIYIDGRLAIEKDIVTTSIDSSFDDLSGIAALQFGYAFWTPNIGKVLTYFDDVKATVYNLASDAPVISGAEPKNEITNDDKSSNTALGISYFYTPPIENLNNSSMSTVMFVNDKTTIADIKTGFTFGGKTWIESNAVVRDSDGYTVSDESLPIKDYYLALTDANGKNYYIKPYCGTVEVDQTCTFDKGMCEMLTDQSAHGRDGLEVIRQPKTRNEARADGDTVVTGFLDNGKGFEMWRHRKPLQSEYVPVTVSGDFYMDLVGETTVGVNVKYYDVDGGTQFWSIRDISASNDSIYSYYPFYPNAWNKIAITIYPGTGYADFYVNGIFVRRYQAPKTIGKIDVVKMLLNTPDGADDSKGAVYMDNFKVEVGIYQIPETTERHLTCNSTEYADFYSTTRDMKLKQTITRGDLTKAIGNLEEFEGYGLFTDNAKTEITDDNYVIKENDILLVKRNGIWKYYRITLIPITVGKITMTQAGGEITDGKFSTGDFNVSIPIVSSYKGYTPVIFIASYSGGNLKNIAVNNNDAISAGSVISGNAQIPENADNVTIYLWENGTMQPLASCISLTKRD